MEITRVGPAGEPRRTADGNTEYACTKALSGRLGYIRRSDDRDELTQRNEFKSNTLTTGFGLRPLGSTWAMDLGWAIEWLAPDFPDATAAKESRQQVAVQVVVQVQLSERNAECPGRAGAGEHPGERARGD